MKRSTQRLAAGAAALICIPAATAVIAETRISPGRNAIVIPDRAPVRFISFGRDETAKFKGRFELRGTYRYGYATDGPPSRSRHSHLALSFAPDLSVAQELPYWQGLAPPAALEFSNERTFLRRMVPPAVFAKLKQKTVLSISGQAHIVVDDYRAGLLCGDARYSARFVSLVHPHPISLTQTAIRDDRC